MESKDRLLSLDALRGFDMLFLMGLAGILQALAILATGSSDCWLAQQMHHVDWNGFRQRDTIFPLFLFIAGVAWPFSFAAQLAKGRSMGAIRLRVLKRAVLLVLLGMMYNGILAFDEAHFRVCSVLGLIGVSWAAASLLYTVAGVAGRICVAVAIMVGYALVLLFVPSPAHPGASPMSLEGCLAGYVNQLLLPGRSGAASFFEPEGVLSAVSSVATAILGTLAGDFVRNRGVSGARKAAFLAVAGVLMAVAAWALDGVLPINKKLWTPTFTLAAGGYSLVLFSLFYWICDVRGWRGWAFPLRVVGMNPITVYLLMRIVPGAGVVGFFLGGVVSLVPSGPCANLVTCLGTLALWWLVLLFLYRKNVFLKV